MELTAADLQAQLTRRRPGQSALTTPVRPCPPSALHCHPS